MTPAGKSWSADVDECIWMARRPDLMRRLSTGPSQAVETLVNLIKLLGAAVLGVVLGGGVTTAIIHKTGFTSERRATRLFMAGCKIGFANGYAARELWSAEDIAISQNSTAKATEANDVAAQNARQQVGRDIENFRRQTANAEAYSIADTLAVREICGQTMQRTPLSPANVDRILRGTVAH